MNQRIALAQPLALHTTDATLAPWLTANFANACCTVAGAGYVATLATVATTATKKRTCTTAPRYGTIHTKPKGPVCEDTLLGTAVAAPTDERGFFTPEFFRHGFTHIGMVLGGVRLPARMPAHGCSRVFKHSRPPSLRVKTHLVASKSRTGAKTMNQVNPLGHHAPTKAAPAIPTTTDSASEVQAHALLQVVTSINLAGLYVRRDNIAQARRKLRQALQALGQLEEVQHA
jgi:hypothetical protein